MKDLAPHVYYVQVKIEILKQHHARVWMDITTLLYQNVLNVLINALLVNPRFTVLNVMALTELIILTNVCVMLAILITE